MAVPMKQARMELREDGQLVKYIRFFIFLVPLIGVLKSAFAYFDAHAHLG